MSNLQPTERLTDPGAITQRLSSLADETYVRLTYVSEMKIPAKHSIRESCAKRSVMYGWLNKNYAQEAEQRIVKAGGQASDYQPGKRAWGTVIPGTPLVTHKGEYYLDLILDTDTPPAVTYVVDGQEATPQQVETLRSVDRDNESWFRCCKIVKIETLELLPPKD